MKWRTVAALLAWPLSGLAQAPLGPTGILLPGNAVVNEPVRVVIDFAAAQPWCGLRVDFGDGDVSDVLVEDFPLTIIRRYAAPGRYVVRAEGRLLLRGMASSPGCTGARRSAVITVADSQRDAQPPRPIAGDKGDWGNDGNKGDQRAGGAGGEGVDAGERGRDDRRDPPGRQGRDDRQAREDRERRDRDPDRSAQEAPKERGSRGAPSREADPPPVRTTNRPMQPAMREPSAAAEPTRRPAPRKKPARDESLKVF